MKPGSKLKSAVCDTEVMVIKGSDVAIECGGAPMAADRPTTRGEINPSFADGTKIGKRYVDASDALELLCRSEEHTSELQSLMRISYAVFCLKKKITHKYKNNTQEQ